jgi:GTP cyclohydrolase II
MFTYLDPSVRERLIADRKLKRIDRNGDELAHDDVAADGGSISILGPIPLPMSLDNSHVEAQWHACVRNTELRAIHAIADKLRVENSQESFADLASSMAVNSVMILGDSTAWTQPLIRVHSSCLTGDVFGSERCECGPQLATALQRIATDREGGMLVYMSGHEGRGIGLWAKAATYLLQDAGEDTYQANRSLGLPDDSRDFSDAAVLIRHFYGDGPIRLLSNNPKKASDLAAYGVGSIETVKHVAGITDSNRRYLEAKREWGHALDPADIQND